VKRAMTPVLVLLLVTACSGKGSSTAAKADYIKKAEDICRKANTEQSALKTPTAVDGLSAYVSQVVDIADRATQGLKALKPPAGDAKALQEKVFGPLTAQLELGHAYADKVAVAVKAQDNATLIKLFADPPNKTKADLAWMRSYGFAACVDAADTSN
jgi:hypothetical protein